jgi:hypothetical protein
MTQKPVVSKSPIDDYEIQKAKVELLALSWELFTRKATVGKGKKIGKKKSIALSN